MARLARIVIPHMAHHVAQRGNRRLPVFFADADRESYPGLLAEFAQASQTRCLGFTVPGA
jgi:putative transposase